MNDSQLRQPLKGAIEDAERSTDDPFRPCVASVVRLTGKLDLGSVAAVLGLASRSSTGTGKLGDLLRGVGALLDLRLLCDRVGRTLEVRLAPLEPLDWNWIDNGIEAPGLESWRYNVTNASFSVFVGEASCRPGPFRQIGRGSIKDCMRACQEHHDQHLQVRTADSAKAAEERSGPEAE